MNNFVTYPFLIIRYYCNESLSIPANGFKWIDISYCKTSDHNKYNYFTSTKENYIASGIIAFGGGESNSLAHKLGLNSICGTGFRLFNFSSSTITTTTKIELNSNGSIKNRPPFVDMLYIRKDMFLYQ